MEVRLVTNRVAPTQVEETDDAYLIRDVPFHKPKEDLDGGYTPKDNLEQTTVGWDGVPATLFHVRNNQGKPIAAHNQPEKHIGTVEDPDFDGEFVNAGTLRINKAALEEIGEEAEQIRDALESGEPIEVSSQYATVDLPPGEYDGAHRSNASAIVRPDSVAILPEGSGRCSITDGCGINPKLAANSTVSVPMTDDPSGGEDHGNPDPDDDAASSDSFFAELGRRVASSFGIDQSTTGAESPADSSSNTTMEDSDKIDFIVANSEFDRENVEQWDGEECLTRLYEQVKANEDADDDDGTGQQNNQDDTDDDDDNSTDDDVVVSMTKAELLETIDERATEKAEAIAANQQEQAKKNELASTIVANSAEYDDTDSVLEDYPTVPALESKRDHVTDPGGLPGSGMSANFEQEDDVDDEGVTAGVFN